MAGEYWSNGIINGGSTQSDNATPRVMVVSQDTLLAESVHGSLVSEGYEATRFTDPEEAYAFASRQPLNLAIIDSALPDSGGYNLLLRLHQDPAKRELPVLLLTSPGEVANRIPAFQFGLDDYLTKPFHSAELTFRVKSQLARNPAAPSTPAETRNGKIIASFGTKGGVGKTIVAVNLAVALARRTTSKVALVDADFSFGEIALHFSLTPKLTILNVLDHTQDLDDYLMNQVMMTTSSGVRVLLSPPSPEDGERVTARDVGPLLDYLAKHYDYVVVDCSPSYAERSLTILEKADAIMLLVTPDVGALKNMGAFFTVAYHLGLANDRIHVVLNRADSKSGIDAAEIEKSFKRKIEYRIPSAGQAVTMSVNRGEPLASKNPNHLFTQPIYRMADSLVASLAKKKG